MTTVLRLSLRQLGSRWRLLLVVALAALPVGLTALLSASQGDDSVDSAFFTNVLLDGLLMAVILPIVTIVLATASFGNEVEDRTLSYLTLRPVSRWLIALPKALAPFIIAGPVMAVSCAAVVLIGGGGILGSELVASDNVGLAILAAGVSALTAAAAYTAIFTWAGLAVSRALAFGLLYVFVWEGVVTTFLGGVRYFSVRAYSLAILNGIDGSTFESLEGRVIELPAAVVGVVVVVAAFFLLTVRQLRRMDVP